MLWGKKRSPKDKIRILLSWRNRQDMMSHIPPGFAVVLLSLQCALKVSLFVNTGLAMHV